MGYLLCAYLFHGRIHIILSFQIGFEAIKGTAPINGIGVDEIVITTGFCNQTKPLGMHVCSLY